MTTEERLVRAATRNLEPEYWELRFHSERPIRTHNAMRLVLTLWAVVAIAGTAVAHKAQLIAFPLTYVVALALFILIALLWSEQ